MSGLLEIMLVDAQGLPESDVVGKMDPYVLIQYKTHKLKSYVAKEPNGHYDVRFKIFDRDTLSADDLIGETTISVKDIVELGVEKGKATVEPRKYSVFESKNGELTAGRAGDLHVGFTFTTKQVYIN
ncbi:hypothetical protein MKX03_022004 [Papaver bracteatum]|nr:hypothetical protein MKX03_022004 [Papaver bracteatum]